MSREALIYRERPQSPASTQDALLVMPYGDLHTNRFHPHLAAGIFVHPLPGARDRSKGRRFALVYDLEQERLTAWMTTTRRIALTTPRRPEADEAT